MTRDKELRRELLAQLRASLLEGKRGIMRRRCCQSSPAGESFKILESH